jgi:hypothetical protein
LRQPLTERYRERLAGVLSWYDRIIVTGTLPGACYAKGMTGFLYARQIRIFDYPRFAEPLRDRVRKRAAELASAAGITIEHIACHRGFPNDRPRRRATGGPGAAKRRVLPHRPFPWSRSSRSFVAPICGTARGRGPPRETSRNSTALPRHAMRRLRGRDWKDDCRSRGFQFRA